MRPIDDLWHTPRVDAPHRFAAALTELFERLDWRALGKHYCFEGGDDFFDEAARESLFEAEIGFASEVVERLQASESASLGRSLYVGAALSELGPMLGEALLLDRQVAAFSLDTPETRELNRAIREVATELELDLPLIRTTDLQTVTLEPYDHLWMVSVLNDPEAFPALHDKLYEREGSELAMNRGDLAEEEERAIRLTSHVFTCLSRPGLLTTSDEEAPLVRSIASELGLALDALSDPILSAVVEDPVRFWSVEQSH